MGETVWQGRKINKSFLFTRKQAVIEVCTMLRMVQETTIISASLESSNSSEMG